MEDKDYTRSRKDNLCDDSIFQEMKIINITFPSDPLFSKLNGRKFFNGLENYCTSAKVKETTTGGLH